MKREIKIVKVNKMNVQCFILQYLFPDNFHILHFKNIVEASSVYSGTVFGLFFYDQTYAF